MALRIGTRGSALAIAQATSVARALEADGATVELVTIKTAGDETAARPETEDKARFVKELEQALVAGEIDLAVHSAKDVPSELLDGLEIVAVPERADARDALCRAPDLAVPEQLTPHSPAAQALDPLPEGATVGTASLRRRAELLALRPDLEIRELRGNVDTRLRKLAAGEFDAIVLAAAGLARLGRADEGTPLSELALIPAAGQGCLALEARDDDDATRKLACRLTDPQAFACVTAERMVTMALGSTCNTPVGAHARVVNHSFIELTTFVGTPDGKQWVRDDVRGMAEDPRSIGLDAVNRLTAAGAPKILAAAEAYSSR